MTDATTSTLVLIDADALLGWSTGPDYDPCPPPPEEPPRVVSTGPLPLSVARAYALGYDPGD
jgi:hypothetical protein